MPELPFEIWKERVNNEIKILSAINLVENKSIAWYDNSVELWINLSAFGFIKKESEGGINVMPQMNHRILIKINRSFPYPGGIDFAWYSEIFHPNIHPIELEGLKRIGTGYICLNILRQWTKLSDLETTVKSLEKLVENPNLEDPLQYDICIEAAEFFKRNSIQKLKKIYKAK